MSRVTVRQASISGLIAVLMLGTGALLMPTEPGPHPTPPTAAARR